MKKIAYITLIALGFILTACPYESDIEISSYEESLKVDKGLKGEWVAYHDDGDREELKLEKIARSVYQVSHKEITVKNKLSSSSKYRIYATEIGEAILFNIENKEGKYLFAKYSWTSKNEFYIEAINDDFMSNNFKVDSITVDNLRTFFTKNINNGKMFDDKLEFYRKDSPEHQKVKMFMRKSGF